MKKLCRALTVALGCCMVIGNVNVANAAIKHKDLSRTRNYYDSLISSWKLGSVQSKITFSYDSSTNKLYDEKSASVTGSVTGCSVKNKKASWDWYNTSTKNGSGQVTCSWQVFTGVTTTWVSLGFTQEDISQRTRVYGNCSWSFLD